MKKFWIVLLALGLVAGFAMSASAADVKFSGSYYVYGIYVDNPAFVKDGKKAQAYYHQRLRIQTEFKVAEGLSLVTRFDALEKDWGQGVVTNMPAGSVAATGWRASNGYDVTNRASTGLAGARTQENIEFERAYIDFTTKIGRFNVGYQNFIAWGTMFLDTHVTRPGIKYFIPIGPVVLVAAIEKTVEQSVGNGITSTAYVTDADNNIYDLGAIFKFGAGEAGILWQYGDNKANRRYNNTFPMGTYAATGLAGDAAGGSKTTMHIINPYAKLKLGPVYFEAEGVYGFGKWLDYDVLPTGPLTDIDAVAYGLYLHAKADIGPAYVGGIAAYMSGDDAGTTDKKEGGFAAALLAGQAWDPCLILWNDGLYGGDHRAVGTGLGPFFDNAFLLQVYGGFKPIKPLDIMASLTYARLDRQAAVNAAYDIGYELDLVAKYKIFDNLEYMVAGGYLFAGDAWKGANKAGTANNNYMLIHKLTLSF
jgi:hypothetical protein